jgi:hypothetical protein
MGDNDVHSHLAEMEDARSLIEQRFMEPCADPDEVQRLRLLEAGCQRKVAERYCARGHHLAAADSFEVAARMFERAGYWTQAANMRGQAINERAIARPSAPVNVSALVD